MKQHSEQTNTNNNDARNRIGLVIFMSFYAFFFGGAFYGWGPMQVMLENHGAFSFKCDNTNDTEEENSADPPKICAQQTVTLINIQLLATVLSNALSPFLGEIADRFGAPQLMNLVTFSAFTSLTFLIIATTFDIPQLLWAAFPILGTAAVGCSIFMVYAGMVFAKLRTRNRVISFLNNLYDGGGVTYLLLWRLQTLLNASLTFIYGFYFAMAVVCFLGNSYFWRVVVPSKNEEDNPMTPEEDEEEEDGKNGTKSVPDEENIDEKTTKTKTVSSTTISTGQRNIQENAEGETTKTASSTTISIGQNAAAISVKDGDQALDKFEDESACESQTKKTQNPNHILVSHRSPLHQLTSQQFLLLAAFFSFYMAKDIMTVTTAKDFLTNLGDDEFGNRYLTIFSLLMPATVVGLPLVDWILHRYGFSGGFQMINALTLTQGIIRLSTKNLNIQVIGFVLHSFFRCFFFSVTLSYLPSLLAPNVTGKANGILHACAGIFGLINVPLSNWAIRGLDGNFFFPYLIYELCSVPWIALVVIMDRHIKKENALRG